MSRASAAENSTASANAASGAGAPSLNAHPIQNDAQASASTDSLRPYQPVAPGASQPDHSQPDESSPPPGVARRDQARLDQSRLDKAEAKPRPHFVIFHDPLDPTETVDSNGGRPGGAEKEPDGGTGLRARVRRTGKQPGTGPVNLRQPKVLTPEIRLSELGTAQIGAPVTPNEALAKAAETGDAFRHDASAGPNRFDDAPDERPSSEFAADLPPPDELLRVQARQLAGNLRARRRELERHRSEFEADCQRRRDAAEAELAKRQQLLEARLARVAEREQQADQQEAALEQLRAEVLVLHQEALETRIACEQVWAQLVDRVELPKLVQSIASQRRRLAEQQAVAMSAQEQQREALAQLAHRLDQRQQSLRRQRDELQQWVARRHEELEVQTAQLVAREEELLRQQQLQFELKQQVQNEVRQYQRTIRKLTAQLRCKDELSQLGDDSL